MRGSAAAHSGKPPAYRLANQMLRRLRLHFSKARGIALGEKEEFRPESRGLSAMCCGRAAILLSPSGLGITSQIGQLTHPLQRVVLTSPRASSLKG